MEKLFLSMGSADIAKLEAILDLFYYSLYSDNVRFAARELRPIAKIFKKETDVKNASVIMRLKHHGIVDKGVLEKYFIKGGTKSFASFVPIMDARGEEDALKLAARLFELKGVPSDVVELETMLGNQLAGSKLKAFYHSPLSAGTILGFLFLKEEEINNLRKAAVGKEFGLPDEKIREMLVFPS